MRRRAMLKDNFVVTSLTLSVTSTSVCFCIDSDYTTVRVNGTAYKGDGITVSITSGGSWITSASFSKSSGRLNVNMDYNMTTSNRSGNVKVSLGDFSANFKVTQNANKFTAPIVYTKRDGSGGFYQYNFGTWPSTTEYYPIGLRVPNKNYFIGFVNDEDRWYFGGARFDVAGITNVTTSTNAKADYNGKSNTQALWNLDNSYSTAWQTASSINNISSDEHTHPRSTILLSFFNIRHK